MPFYELTLIMRNIEENLLKDAVRRCCKLLWDKNALVKDLEYSGLLDLTHTLRKSGRSYTIGNRFLVRFVGVSRHCDINLAKVLYSDDDVLSAHSIKISDSSFTEQPYVHCRTLPDYQNCLFGELTDWKWHVKKRIKYQQKQPPAFIMNRKTIDREDELNLAGLYQQ
ncbi:MAG: 28S ribosomal protein S6, mitochondrial [Marteilia pararefringens]